MTAKEDSMNDPCTSHLPPPKHPVVAITVTKTGDRYRVFDDGGAFELWDSGTSGDVGQRRLLADVEARRRMGHYCDLGHPVLPWDVPL